MTYTYLALGDSYTIGEALLPAENFPSQVVHILRNEGFDFSAPEIIAKTGWTTNDLQNAIEQYHFRPSYDFVTLLIGVNNQYRGGKTDEYRSEFENLLKQAIQFTDGKNKRVIVLSIPDWGVTSFAKDRDKKKISKEIEAYNIINKIIAEKFKVNYIDITPGTKGAANDPDLLAADGLHPSAKEYFRWAKKTASVFKQQLK